MPSAPTASSRTCPRGLVEAAVADYYRYVELGDDLVTNLKQRLADDLDTIRGRSRDTVRHQQTRVDRLRAEEQKLLHLFYRDKITDELFEQEQTRIATQLTDARRTLAAVQSEYAEGQRIVELALDLARDCQHAYQLAEPPTRRLFNQVFFTKIFIDAVDSPAPIVAGAELASPSPNSPPRNQPHTRPAPPDDRWPGRRPTTHPHDQGKHPPPTPRHDHHPGRGGRFD